MGKVVLYDGFTKLPINAERVREAAEKNCEQLVVIGVDKSGKDYYASNIADSGQVCLMVQRFLHKLVSGGFE